MNSPPIQPNSQQDVLFIEAFNWLITDADAELRRLRIKQGAAFINSVIFPKICFVVSHPHFEQRPPDNQFYFIQKAAALLMTIGSRKAAQVAGLLGSVSRKIFRNPTVSLLSKASFFSTMYHLYWQADSTIIGVAPVNDTVVQPFSDFLKETFTEQDQYHPPVRRHTRPRIGYFVNFTHVAPIAAGVTLFISIINGHAQACPDHDIFIYTYRPGDMEPFVAAVAGSKAVYRHLLVGGDEDNLRNLRDLIRSDELDYLITDAATGISTYLYEVRCAPRQVYAYMGFCCWRIKNLDLVYGFTFPWRDWMGFDPDRYLTGPVALESSRSLREATPEELAEARARFPKDVKILGFFGRFIKVTEDYLAVVARILKAHPNVVFFAAGFGDPSIFDDILADPEIGKRVHTHVSPVDVSVYGRIVEMMLDSFPFAGGNILREMLFLGKPVVALHTPMMELHYENTIDPSLIARSRDDYEALVGRLLTDEEFYRERSEAARQYGLKATDIKSENGELIRRVMTALPLEA